MMIVVKNSMSPEEFWATIPTDVPVLFWDTCGLLDCLRIAKRYGQSYYDNYLYVKGLIERQEIISVISDMVISELENNWDSIYEEGLNFQRTIREAAQKFMQIHGIDNERIAEQSQILENANVVSDTNDILKKILENTYVIKSQNDFRDFAHMRITAQLPPAHVKQEYKDSYIWGCVCHCAGIRSDKTRKVYFISSNTTDYCETGEKTLAAQIISDCDLNFINFAMNIGHLRGLFE